ncbi:hypothetical protein CRG98_044537 [Punica granatum]|uniref:Uncharacterized protein n=1 Tax=Punica granatum TaxID=22663 RepID=A0A2I0HTM9_PUNGR|nr:hypothetical protein CRG98_044537 [Punica granatum]
MPDLLTRASSPSCTASSPNHLVRAPCNLAGSANTCEFTFLHRKFIEPPRSCPLQACRLVPLATLPGLLTRASLLSCTASSPNHLPRAYLNLAGSANLCEFTFSHLKFIEPPRSFPWQACRLSRERLLSCTTSSPSNLSRASCNLTGSTNPCEFTFLHRKFAEPPRSCLLQPCRPPQVRLPTSFVPHATLPGLPTRGSLPSCTASSPNHLARAPCNLAGSADPCEFTFLHRKFAEPPRSCLLQPCRVSYPVRDYFPAPQVLRATSLVPPATLRGLLTHASLLSYTASSPSHLARASCNLADLRKFAYPPRSCLMQPCRVCQPGGVYLPAPQVRRTTSLVPLATLPGLLTRASLLSCIASSPNHLARAYHNLAGSANPCEFTFLHHKLIEPPCSCPLQACRVC